MCWGFCWMSWVSCRYWGGAVIDSCKEINWEWILFWNRVSRKSLSLLCYSIYILQSHHFNQVCAIINIYEVHILFNSHLSQEHVKMSRSEERVKFQLLKILTSVLQRVSSQGPVSPKIMPSLPQSTRQGLDFTFHVRAGVNLCALATARQWCSKREKRCQRLSISCRRVPRLVRNVGSLRF